MLSKSNGSRASSRAKRVLRLRHGDALLVQRAHARRVESQLAGALAQHAGGVAELLGAVGGHHRQAQPGGARPAPSVA